MEKHTPHCSLAVVKVMLEAGKVRATISALEGAAALGLDFSGVMDVVMALTPKDFYKSRRATVTTGYGKMSIAL